MKEFICTNCSNLLTEDQLVTVTNLKWVMKPTDNECCPKCKELCIELEKD